MDPAALTKFVEFFQSGGPYAFIVILLVGIGFLWRRNNALQDKMESVAKEVTKALEMQNKSIVTLAIAFENTNKLNEERLDALRSMSAQIAPVAQMVAQNGTLMRAVSDLLQSIANDVRDLFKLGRT